MDPDVLSTHCRNAIYILATGLNSTDSFRLEVKLTVEYIPTSNLKPWVECNGNRATNSDQMALKDIIIRNPRSQSTTSWDDFL